MSDWKQACTLSLEIAAHPLHPSLDCTEIVDRFCAIAPSGTRRYITAIDDRPHSFVVWERGRWREFVYHAVFVLDHHVFDPYWSAEPLPIDAYWQRVQSANPHQALHWRESLPATFIQ